MVVKKSILKKAKPVSSLELSVCALFYGRSGTGKTTLAATFPSPILLIDIRERGTDSISDVPNVDSISVDDWDQIEDIYWDLKDTKHNYKTVVIDALHSLQNLAIEKAKSEKGKKPEDATSQNDFGQASKKMLTWMEHYRDLNSQGINVVMLCHDKVIEYDTDDEADVILPEVGARLMPSLASAIAGIVNVVGCTYIRQEIIKSKKAGEKPRKNIQFCLRLGPHEYYLTKIRKPKNFSVPEFIVDPSYDKIKQVIQGKYKPQGSQVRKRKVRRK